ncbi:MAG TPA: serine/threonine-protein kinase [Thermoleophilaceae bacterium]
MPLEREPLLDRYRLEKRLGSGGFGVVWSAWDEKLEREVAVKVIRREGGDARIVREARAAARLNHPGIVGLYELAADDDDLYLVSELVNGRTLAELEKGKAVSDRDVARIGTALCEALDHAHARGVIHRDVKPQNVMVVAEPAAGAGFAKLTDFGVAHVASAERVTRTGDVVGTLEYMAPEQAEGREATPLTDVYSLALTLYEAWTGTNPVRGRGPAATAKKIGRPLPSLGERRRDLPPDLCDAIDDALEPDPSLRPSPRELAEDLRAAEPELSSEGGLVEPETLERMGLASARRILPRGGEWLVRAAAGAALGALVLVALTALGPEPPVSPWAAAAAAAALTAFLPRVGWLAAALGVCGWLASPAAGQEGTALLLLAALVPVPLMLPRAGKLWSLPALAPLLGAIGLAPAFVGAAALVRGTWRRAALAAAGFVWLAATEVLSGRALLFGVPDGVLPRADWQGSVTEAASHALGPLISSPALAPALVWAALAPVLPLVVRGRYVGLDLLAAGAWAAVLVTAQAALGDLLASVTALDQPRGGPVGPIAAALVVFAAAMASQSSFRGTGEPVTAGRGIP